jgi:hypothetical protein
MNQIHIKKTTMGEIILSFLFVSSIISLPAQAQEQPREIYIWQVGAPGQGETFI